jgi:hypothetical protein
MPILNLLLALLHTETNAEADSPVKMAEYDKTVLLDVRITYHA